MGSSFLLNAALFLLPQPIRELDPGDILDFAMDTGTAKVLSLALFIFLGYLLRRLEILRAEAFHAVSGLVLCVTLPCVVITGLNGVAVTGDMVWVVILGFLSNLLFLGIATLFARKAPDEDTRAFDRLNLSGFSIGPFAIPYIQAFYPGAGFLTTIVFDIGNSVMSAGGTYAVVAGAKEKTTAWGAVKNVGGKLLRSRPTLSYLLMLVLSFASIRLPDAVTTCTSVAANANTFLCMVMIGESINISMPPGTMKRLLKLLGERFLMQAALAAAFYFLLPFDLEVRRALALVAFSPVPAMNLIYTAKMEGDLALAANLSSMSVGVAIVMMSVLAAIL